MAGAGAFTVLKFAAVKKSIAIQTNAPAILPPEPTPPAVKEESSASENKSSASINLDSIVALKLAEQLAAERDTFALQLIPLLDTGDKLAQNISSFPLSNLSDLSDSEYESRLNRARSLRTQSTSLERKLKAITIPQSQMKWKARLEETAENLRLAGYSLARFFNAENADQEAQMRNQARRYSKSAQDNFIAIRKDLQP